MTISATWTKARQVFSSHATRTAFTAAFAVAAFSIPAHAVQLRATTGTVVTYQNDKGNFASYRHGPRQARMHDLVLQDPVPGSVTFGFTVGRAQPKGHSNYPFTVNYNKNTGDLTTIYTGKGAPDARHYKTYQRADGSVALTPESERKAASVRMLRSTKEILTAATTLAENIAPARAYAQASSSEGDLTVGEGRRSQAVETPSESSTAPAGQTQLPPVIVGPGNNQRAYTEPYGHLIKEWVRHHKEWLVVPGFLAGAAVGYGAAKLRRRSAPKNMKKLWAIAASEHRVKQARLHDEIRDLHAQVRELQRVFDEFLKAQGGKPRVPPNPHVARLMREATQSRLRILEPV